MFLRHFMLLFSILLDKRNLAGLSILEEGVLREATKENQGRFCWFIGKFFVV